MKDKLIQTVGKLWMELGSQGKCSTYDLSQFLKEEEEVVHLAMGWLIREDKVRCENRKRDLIFSLVETEQEAFERSYGDSIPKKRKSFWRKKFLN